MSKGPQGLSAVEPGWFEAVRLSRRSDDWVYLIKHGLTALNEPDTLGTLGDEVDRLKAQIASDIALCYHLEGD